MKNKIPIFFFVCGCIIVEVSMSIEIENAYIFFWGGIILAVIGIIMAFVSGTIKKLIEIFWDLF